MQTIYFLILFIILLSAISLIVLIGDLPNYRGTILHKLNSLLVDKLFHGTISHLEVLDKKYFNGLLTSENSKRKIYWLSGWVIPAFYTTIITKFLQLFFTHTFPQIKRLEKDSGSTFSWNSRLYLIIIPVIFINYASFLLAVFTNPGYIEPHNPKLSSKKLFPEFSFDNLIFFEDTSCSTCKISKPARSKHCSNCDKCVLMFDHHCIWLNNDVAYYTFRWFFYFLCSVCFIFIYGAYLSFYCLHMYLEHEKLPKVVLDTFGIKKYWKLIKYTTFTNEITGIMFLLCILLFPLVAFFLGETIWSIYLGVTTNEIAKWDYINNYVKHEVLYEYIPEDDSPSTFLLLNEKLTDGTLFFVTLKNRLPFSSDIGGNLKKIEGWNDMTNIYDRGFWNNMRLKLFPKSFQ